MNLKYPNQPGHHATAPETSAAAAPSVSRAETLRARCLAALRRYGAMTADECAEGLNEEPGSVRPRFSELRRFGKITDTGTRRTNTSGKTAAVWKAAI